MHLINIPGLRNSGPKHWQSIWEHQYPHLFHRIHQHDWERPNCDAWTQQLNTALKKYPEHTTILIGHSVGCATIVNGWAKYQWPISAAIFVAPSDVDHPNYPPYITGFSPIHTEQLPFPSLVIASSNDYVVSPERAAYFAHRWGSQYALIPDAGHLEDKAGYGEWNEGLLLIQKFAAQYLNKKLLFS